MTRLCLYYIQELEHDRWLPGDRHVRAIVRRILRGAPRPGGVDKVFINLCLGLDRLNMKYEVNLPFDQLQADDLVGILGRGHSCLDGYNKPNPIVAGIGLMTHPSEWPDLCEQYPVVKYLQHSQWANEVYKPYFGDRCVIWPVGIDTLHWQPGSDQNKTTDFLIYNKIHWNHEHQERELLAPIRQALVERQLSFQELCYGSYKPQDYRIALGQCRAMIFLCEHESQGIAYQECLASGVPILAWDQGEVLDPNRFAWGTPHIPATSVPYWDERCGIKFKNFGEFSAKIDEFLDKQKRHEFAPRDYIMENLTLEICASKYLDIVNEIKATG